MFGIAGEKLTMRLRVLMFKSMLVQEMGWYDRSSNGVGALCARLSGEASQVQGVSISLKSFIKLIKIKSRGNWTTHRNNSSINCDISCGYRTINVL